MGDQENMMEDGAEGGVEESPGGYCIELKVGADGQMSISVEPEAEEAGEEQTPDAGTPVAGIKEAMQVIMDIIKNDGQMMDATAGDDEFAQGFGPAQGPQPQGAAVAKRFG